MTDRDILEKRIAWQKKMHAAGWAGISWPKEYGGRGSIDAAGHLRRGVFPRPRPDPAGRRSGLNLLGPTLIHWGTEAQKSAICRDPADEVGGARASPNPAREAISRACRTRAVGRRRLRGQRAEGLDLGRASRRLVFLLVRTDPEAPKHHGISFLLVDMKTPGITVRPLILMNGHASTRCSSKTSWCRRRTSSAR